MLVWFFFWFKYFLLERIRGEKDRKAEKSIIWRTTKPAAYRSKICWFGYSAYEARYANIDKYLANNLFSDFPHAQVQFGDQKISTNQFQKFVDGPMDDDNYEVTCKGLAVSRWGENWERLYYGRFFKNDP